MQRGSKARLLDATIKVARTKGYAAARVEDVCAEVGLTKGGFFHHSKSKDDLALGAAALWAPCPINRRTDMRIYWIKAQAPRRVLALVKHLGLDAEFVEMDLVGGALQNPDYAALNPNRKAPVLVDGDLVLWESSAIMAHLCVKTGSDMWPARDPVEQIQVLRWLSWNDSHWAPAVAPFYFEHIVKGTFGFGPPDREKLRAAVPELLRYGAVLNQHLEGRSHVSCDRLTIADFQLASMASDWRASEAPLAAFPNVVRWLDGMMGLGAWADPWPAPTPSAS